MIALIASSNSIWVEGRQLEFGYKIMRSAWQMRPSENVDYWSWEGMVVKLPWIRWQPIKWQSINFLICSWEISLCVHRNDRE